MEEEERKETREGVKKSYITYRANVAARENDSLVTRAMVYSKMHGGRKTETDSVKDTG